MAKCIGREGLPDFLSCEYCLRAARAACACVVRSYLLASRAEHTLCPTRLQATFALLNWALRETVSQMAFGRTKLSTPGFLIVSYLLLALLYLISVLVPSVWFALSLTGSTAAVG